MHERTGIRANRRAALLAHARELRSALFAEARSGFRLCSTTRALHRRVLPPSVSVTWCVARTDGAILIPDCQLRLRAGPPTPSTSARSPLSISEA
jgi:hypothetical protein